MAKTLDTPLSISDLIALHSQGSDFFLKKWKRGELNEKRYLGEGWTDEEKQQIESQDRLPYSFPADVQKIRTIESLEKQNKTDWEIKANVDPNDEIKAELGTLQIKSIAKRSDWQNIQSDVFRSGLAVQYGASRVWVKDLGYEKQVMVSDLDYKNVVWDVNSVKYDLSDAVFTSEVERLYRQELKAEGFEADEVAEGVITTFEGRDKFSYYVNANQRGERDLDVISKFTHYQRVYRDYYVLNFPDSQTLISPNSIILEEYRSKSKADQRLRELNFIYMAAGFEPEGEVVKVTKPKIDKYVFTHNRIHEYEQLEIEFFPIDVYFAVKFADDFIAFADFLYWPSVWFNRIMSQMDYSMGVDTKNVKELNVNALADNETPDSAADKANETGAVVYKKTPEPIFTNVQSAGMNPQWVQIASIIQTLMEDMGGGRNFQGLAEGGGQSGRAVLALQNQGILVASLLFDNLRRWKKQVGEKILKLASVHETTEQIIRINGEELTPQMMELLQNQGLFKPSMKEDGSGFVTVNKEDQGLPYLKDAEFELTVSEQPLTDGQKEATYLKLTNAVTAIPSIPNINDEICAWNKCARQKHNTK